MYNFDKKEVEGYVVALTSVASAHSSLSSRVPVLHDVRDITLTRPIAGQEQVALVSYENKVRLGRTRIITLHLLACIKGSASIMEDRRFCEDRNCTTFSTPHLYAEIAGRLCWTQLLWR